MEKNKKQNKKVQFIVVREFSGDKKMCIRDSTKEDNTLGENPGRNILQTDRQTEK